MRAASLGQRLEQAPRLQHREAAAALAAGLAGARPTDGPPLDPELLADGARAERRARAAAAAAAGDRGAHDHARAERAAVIRAALGRRRLDRAPGPARRRHDRVVMAVTFLALLELVKRREVVAEQAEPWGPITCRATTAAERAGGAELEAPIDESLADFA